MNVKVESDPVERWLGRSRSEGSQKARQAILNRFCEYEKTTPVKLLNLAGTVLQGQPQSEIEKMIDRYIMTRKHSRIAGSTIAKEVGAIIAFFRANRMVIETPKGLSLEPRYEKHRPLEKTEVKHMIDVASEPYKQAVILTLAQTGQRLRVLTALSWTKSKSQLAVIQESDGWGFVTIRPDMRNWYNETFNRANAHYTFLIHPESMKLLRQIRIGQEDRVFVIHPRHMQEIIEDVALKADIQEPIPRRLNGRKWHEVHADVFRSYWKGRMHKAGLENDLLDYLMGQKVTLEPSRDYLLEQYKKAKASLSLLS